MTAEVTDNLDFQIKSKSKTKTTKKEESVKIPSIQLETAYLTIEGTSPLIIHPFGEKAKGMMKDKHEGIAKNKREKRDPYAEYLANFYRFQEDNDITKEPKRYGIPAGGLKNCAVSACSFIEGITKVVARGAFHIIAEPGSNLVEVKSKEGPKFYEAVVRVGIMKNQADMRYRPIFNDWKIKFKIIYNKNVITPAQIANMYNNAGFSIGLCEHRPEKNGSFGMFTIAND